MELWKYLHLGGEDVSPSYFLVGWIMTVLFIVSQYIKQTSDLRLL